MRFLSHELFQNGHKWKDDGFAGIKTNHFDLGTKNAKNEYFALGI